MTKSLNGCIIYTHPNGEWAVGVLLANDTVAINSRERFASQTSATLDAIRQHNAKPFMNFIAVRA